MADSPGIKRRDYLKLSGTGLATMGLAGCIGGDGEGDGDGDGDGGGGGDGTGGTPGEPGGAAGFDTLSVGLAVPLSGAFGFIGGDFRDGFLLRVDEINASDDVFPDTEIQVQVEDTGSDPEQGLEVARSLVQRENVDLILGGANSETSFGISNFMASEHLPFFMAMSGDYSLTAGERCEWTNARLVPHNGTFTKAHPDWSVNNLGTRAYCLYPDYSTGYTQQGFVEPAIENAGGEIVASTFAPLGNTEWGSILEDIESAEPDWLFFGMVANGQVPFLTQAANRGYDIPLAGTLLLEQITGQLTDELVDQLPDLYRSTRYTREIDNDLNRAFVDNYLEAYDSPPVYASGYGYMNGNFIANAYTEAGTKDTDAVMEAVEGLAWDDIVGGIEVRACDHQAAPAGAITRITGVDEEHAIGEHEVVHQYTAEEIQSFQPGCDELECSFDR